MPAPPNLCSGCQRRLGAQALRVAGMAFHPQCYLCAACGKTLDKSVYPKAGKLYHESCYQQRFLPRCSHCRQTLTAAYTKDAQGRYHPECYTQLHQLFCSLCSTEIQGSYLYDHWGNKAHSAHDGQPTGQCHVCARLVASGLAESRQLSDGRLLCQPCARSEVQDFQAIQAAKLAVIARLQAVGFDYIPDYVKVSLSEDQQLLNQRMRSSPTANIHGLTRTVERQIPGYGLMLEHQIQIISGLPHIAFMGVMAHELLHVWIHENQLRHLSHAQVEGFCNLGTALMMQQAPAEEQALASVLLRRMAEDTDSAYGEGYRAMAWQLQQLGWPALLAALKDPDFVWPEPPAEAVQAREREMMSPPTAASAFAGKAPAKPALPSAQERLQALKQKYQQAAGSTVPAPAGPAKPPQVTATPAEAESEAARKVRERFAQKTRPTPQNSPKLGKLKKKK